MRALAAAAVLLCGCAGAELPTRDARIAVDRAQTALQAASATTAALGRAAVAICQAPAPLDASRCNDALTAYDGAAAALNEVITAVGVVDDSLRVVEELAQ